MRSVGCVCILEWVSFGELKNILCMECAYPDEQVSFSFFVLFFTWIFTCIRMRN